MFDEAATEVSEEASIEERELHVAACVSHEAEAVEVLQVWKQATIPPELLLAPFREPPN